MKILLPVDGSAHGNAAIRELISRSWPQDTEVRVISVAHAFPEIHDPLMMGYGLHHDSLTQERKRAHHDVDDAEQKITHGTPFLTVSTDVLEGSPSSVIVHDAEHWGADLIMVGSHGNGAAVRMLLGSVAHSVALHAPCSVEIVRIKSHPSTS